jgi:hypothetical protein
MDVCEIHTPLFIYMERCVADACPQEKEVRNNFTLFAFLQFVPLPVCFLC